MYDPLDQGWLVISLAKKDSVYLPFSVTSILGSGVYREFMHNCCQLHFLSASLSFFLVILICKGSS
jgi:hypothetical protein